MEEYDSETLQLETFPPGSPYASTKAALEYLERYRDRLSFAVHHLNSMAAALRRKYDEAA